MRRIAFFSLTALATSVAPVLAQGARPASPAPAPSSAPAPATTPGPVASQTPAAPGASGQGALAQPGVQVSTDTTVPPAQTIGWIRVGQSRRGMLENGDYRMGDNTPADVWYFDGTLGQRVEITLESQAFDVYSQLLDPAGGLLAEGRPGPRGHVARIEFTLRESGRHQIVVNNVTSDQKTGPYTLLFR